ncbi:winged helix-turn-helix domain-containing protein, partial [Escherichia coli]|nr:winged helix-turn-helix domain-containing protein [Escherichia coli]
LLATVSRPLVNRSLQELAQEGLITVEHSAVNIRDLGKLRTYGA